MMKLKKKKLILILIFTCFWLLPFIVLAESKGCESVSIELKDIRLGEKGQDSTYAYGGIHFISPTINITWYESSNGSNYTLIDENSTFDYNIYYKAVLDTSYDELNGGFDEGWELCGLSTSIIDEEGKEIDRKSYNSSSKIEYVFEPFWKYKVYLYLDNMDYNGPMEIVEGEDLVGQLIPQKNYRLPTADEVKDQQMVRMFTNGNMSSNYYNSSNGKIEIPSQAIERYIEIHARAVEMTKIEFENNEYIYEKSDINNNLKFSVPFNDDIDTIYINEDIISDSNYQYDKINGILTIHKAFLDNLEIGTYKLRIENKERYAETTLSIKIKSYMVKFDANGGMFINGDVLTIEKWENGLEKLLEQPIRDGYVFIGYFTEKTGGTKLELILSESGIDSNMIFYAQWKEITNSAPGKVEYENPKTFDGVGFSIFVGAISLISLISITMYLKKRDKISA